MTQSKTKVLKEVLNVLILKVSTKSDLKGSLKYQEKTLVHLIHMQEGHNPILFGLWGEEKTQQQKNKRIQADLGNKVAARLPNYTKRLFFILNFLNELNLIYQRLTGFVASFDFIPIVLLSWNRFSLYHISIRPISIIQD